MLRQLNFDLHVLPFYLVHEDPPVVDPENTDDENEDPPVTPPVKPPVAKPKVAFTPEQQSYVNSLLAEDRRKAQAANQKVITQLETLKNNVNTTSAEKEALALQIEDLKNQHLTQDELRKKETKKTETKLQTDLAAKTAEAETWKHRFTDSTIKRSLTDAAVVNKAHNPKHIVSLLASDTRLVEEKDEDGKPTGDFTPMVRVKTTKDGKPATLDMTATEAVKFFSEQDEHAPLFSSGAAGGLGSNPNNPRRKGVNSDTPPTNTAEYMEWRKAQKAKK